MDEVAKCRSCQAPIKWLKHQKSRQLSPIDAEPAAGGNVEVLPGEEYRIVGKAERLTFTGPLHMNHWATCPTKEQHRKPA